MAHLDTELLSAYIDDELSPDDRRQVEEHLSSCEVCRREFEELRGISALVRELPTYLPRRVVEIDESAPHPASGVLPKIIEFSKPLAVAALIVIVAVAGIRFFMDDDDGEQGDGEISFSAVQETPSGGTDRQTQTSESVTAGEAPPNAALIPAEQEGEEADSIVPETGQDSAEDAEMAPGAARQEEAPAAAFQPQAPEPTVATPMPTPVPAETDDDDGPSYLLIGTLVAVAAVVALSAARYASRASPRRTRR